jgi:hypothetical protein
VTKRKKIIVIGVAITLALVIGLGGFVHAISFEPYFDHADVGGNKLLGVGEMGHYYYGETYWDQYQEWDTQFIITNPNCDRDLTIEWVALIAGEDAGPWLAEQVIAEGTPDDWADYTEGDILIPGNDGDYDGELSPHEVWQVSIAELVGAVLGIQPYMVPGNFELDKFTLEVTWSGARYTGWWWWGYWRDGRPLTGWQKEKCWSVFHQNGDFLGFAVSEASMELFHSRIRFEPGEPYFLHPPD